MKKMYSIKAQGWAMALPLCLLAAQPSWAQTREWTLQECCDYAVEHNITVKQQQNQCRQREIDLSTAKNSRLPDVSGSLGQNFSFGRGLTSQNTYTNTNT
jgi:outer membrane protein